MLTRKSLKESVFYDRGTGYFFRLSRYKDGVLRPCGSVDKHGYVSVSVMGKNYPAHKLALFYCYGYWPKNVVDHIDGDRTNNKVQNLMACSHSKNSRNKRMSKKNKTGVAGAYELPYGFNLSIGGVFIGTFKCKKELKVAADSYRAKNGYSAEHGEKRTIEISDMINKYKNTIKNYLNGDVSPPKNLDKARDVIRLKKQGRII